MTREFLTQYDWKPRLPDIKAEELIETQTIISPHIVLREVRRAADYLMRAKGPNQERRKLLAPQWFGYWNNLLSFVDSFDAGKPVTLKSSRMIPFRELKPTLRNRVTFSGIVTFGGGEGTPSHVYCMTYMEEALGNGGITVLGLESDEFMKTKVRQVRFIPLQMLFTMYNYLQPVYLTLMPFDARAAQDHDYFNKRFRDSGIDFGFGSEGEPHALEQSSRRSRPNLPLINTLIPRQTSFSTSDAVQRLHPELEEEFDFVKETAYLMPFYGNMLLR